MQLYNCDNVMALSCLVASESVQLTVTSPPYAEWEDESFEPSYLEREGDTSFEPAKL
jgi:hypothetical protein